MLENVPEWATPIAVLLLLIASQLFWLRRLISLGERFIPGKWGRAGLKAIVGAPCLFFFAYLLTPLHRPHSSTVLTLRNVLLDAPFWWWFVGSLVGSALVMIYRTVVWSGRASAWLYLRVSQVAASSIALPTPCALASGPASPGRRRFLEQSATGVIAVPFVAAGYGLLYERLDIEVTRQRVKLVHLPKAFEGFRIVQLSDFHISPFMTGDQIRRCVTVANGLKPDLVALTGDFISDDPRAQGEVVEALSTLRAPFGVFGCLGNHEYYTKTEESITRLLAAKGIRILRQERASIQSHGDAINLIGVDYQQKRFGTDHDGHLVDEYLEGSEKLVTPGTVNVLLDHNPNAFDRAAELGIDLVLAGHTHGGQVSLDFLHRGLSLAYTETSYVSGWYSKAGSQLYVSRGIGTTGPPIRFGARPEVTVFELARGA
jgi:predicted MPP superfamily phosphohydrolase